MGVVRRLGIVLLVLGVLALSNLVVATVVSVLYVGVLMLIGAVAQIIHAFRVKGWGGFAPSGCSAEFSMAWRGFSPSTIRLWPPRRSRSS